MKNKHCETCAYYTEIYQIGFLTFLKNYKGICEVSIKAVNKKETCKFYKPQSKNKTSIISMLDNAMDDVNALLEFYET